MFIQKITNVSFRWQSRPAREKIRHVKREIHDPVLYRNVLFVEDKRRVDERRVFRSVFVEGNGRVLASALSEPESARLYMVEFKIFRNLKFTRFQGIRLCENNTFSRI